MELGLLTLLGIAAAAALAFVYVPLRGLRRQGQTGAARLVVFFGSLGLGYMAIEMALIQKFGLLLGHPNLALSVVLASLLLATGVGSLLSAFVVRALGGSLRFVSYALSFVLLAELLLVFPRLGLWMALPLPGRVALVAALVAPIGFLLGTYFPTGLERTKRVSPGLVPWAWGLNGMASRVAPILAVAGSMICKQLLKDSNVQETWPSVTQQVLRCRHGQENTDVGDVLFGVVDKQTTNRAFAPRLIIPAAHKNDMAIVSREYLVSPKEVGHGIQQLLAAGVTKLLVHAEIRLLHRAAVILGSCRRGLLRRQIPRIAARISRNSLQPG